MNLETELREEIENFFQQTCINEYFFKQIDPNKLIRMKKKTPVGTWNIKSTEIAYFIDHNDHVIIGVLNSENDESFELVVKILAERAKVIET